MMGQVWRSKLRRNTESVIYQVMYSNIGRQSVELVGWLRAGAIYH